VVVVPNLFEQSQAAKEALRQADDLAIARGEKSPAQIKLESEAFAFGPQHSRLDLSSVPPIVWRLDRHSGAGRK
jgi:hypothetical protein